MRSNRESGPHAQGDASPEKRQVRADARRNLDELLKAAMRIFAASGVDAPVREIAKEAGVGVGTLYRHFPQRSDLVKAVFKREIDACADAAAVLAARNEPFAALAGWMNRYVEFIAAKRGLAAALHSGDPAYEGLPVYFEARLRPALQGLLDAAIAVQEVRDDVKPNDLLRAVASLCVPTYDAGPDYTDRMLKLLLDGLRYGAAARTSRP
ncbi:TetR/AcrR family transcriptional regulator [Ensifer sp. MJa1]|uniref:TetR/AcrR family transcriptional regulator n=1 Tax=Ensifer sp. MJa1 TaxID=2919888 RepID=UPI00300BCAFF